MASPKKKTTIQKLNREAAVRERQLRKKAKKLARRAVADPPPSRKTDELP